MFFLSPSNQKQRRVLATTVSLVYKFQKVSCKKLCIFLWYIIYNFALLKKKLLVVSVAFGLTYLLVGHFLVNDVGN